jgi:hypothetical protein
MIPLILVAGDGKCSGQGERDRVDFARQSFVIERHTFAVHLQTFLQIDRFLRAIQSME